MVNKSHPESAYKSQQQQLPKKLSSLVCSSNYSLHKASLFFILCISLTYSHLGQSLQMKSMWRGKTLLLHFGHFSVQNILAFLPMGSLHYPCISWIAEKAPWRGNFKPTIIGVGWMNSATSPCLSFFCSDTTHFGLLENGGKKQRTPLNVQLNKMLFHNRTARAEKTSNPLIKDFLMMSWDVSTPCTQVKVDT